MAENEKNIDQQDDDLRLPKNNATQDTCGDFDGDGDIPEHITKLLNDVPPEDRKHIERTLIQSFGMVGHMSPESAIMKKITSDHITKYLDASGENMKLGFKDRTQNRIYTSFLIIISLIFFVVLIYALKDNPSLLQNIIYSVVGLVAGAFGGYGYSQHKHGSDDD